MTIKFPTIPSFIFDVCIPSCTSVVQTTQNADSDCSTIPSMAAITIDEDYGNESNNEDGNESNNEDAAISNSFSPLYLVFFF